MINVGGYLEYRGGYHEYRGGYLEYREGCSVPWGDIMMHMGDIMSTVEGVQYRGGNIFCHLSTQNSKDGIPHGTEHPHGTHDIPPRAS